MAIAVRPQAQAGLLQRIRAASQPGAQPGAYASLTRGSDPDLRNRALVAIYGPAFPLVLAGATDDDWAKWPALLWEQHREGVADAVHLGERNRRFYYGDQWISSGLGTRGPWREPPAPKNTMRIVSNKVKPALDYRLQVITEQRPGFRFESDTQDPDDKRRTEARQRGVEYQWHRQKMALVFRESAFWAALHGVSFLYSFWNPALGPSMELRPGEVMPLGDIETRVFRMDQVRVSANATATVRPHYWIIREEIPLAQAILEHGEEVVDADTARGVVREMDGWLGASTAGSVTPLFRSQQTISRFMLFCEPSEYLRGGCQLVVVGNKLVMKPQPLTFGRVTISRVTDGSPDPRFYPRPFFADWVAPQTQINKLRSLWFQNIRVNAGGRLYVKPETFATETMVGGGLSVVELRLGPGEAISNAILPADGFSVGTDVKDALMGAIKDLEDLTGWNDPARGSMGGDPSGRAILANREQLERVFAPPVSALAAAASDWAEDQVAIMQRGYKVPRAIGVTGTTRPDLGRMLSSEDLDGTASCHVNPETMMPQPTSLRLYDLDQMLEKGAIDAREWRRRRPNASTLNIETPDDLQEAKAQRVCEAFRMGVEPEPMLWVDDEAIHQDVIQHEILLAPDIDESIRAHAFARWVALANQSAEKQGMVGGPPPPDTGSGDAGGGPSAADSMFAPTPSNMPLAAANPSVAAPPPASALPPTASGAAPDATQLFETVAPQ